MEEENASTSTSIDLSGGGSVVVNLSGQVHNLPCCVKYDGPSEVAHYFKPKSTGVEVDGLKTEEAHFRGRKLQGATISLPKGYSGFVLGKKKNGKRKASCMTEGNSCWEMKANFDKLTYWNNESLPSQDDAFSRSFHWFAVAEALHKPVKAEDLVSTSTAQQKD